VTTSVYFEYSTSPDFSNPLQTAPQLIGSGNSLVNVTGFLSGLQASTLYYYRVVTTGSGGIFRGPSETLTTLACSTSLVAMTGSNATDAAGATYGMYASLSDPIIDNTDGVAFEATLEDSSSNPVITAANNSGIWANESTSTLTLVAQSGSIAPGTAGATFMAFSDPVYAPVDSALVNAVAFTGTLKVASGQATAATARGV
jgi:hypothetical protein